MDTNQLITIFSILIGSGLIQFLLTRKDTKKEKEKKDSSDSLRKEMKDHLTDVNNKWKTDYCDKNAKAIEDVAKELKEGLEERERTGLQRFEEHKESIEELRQAILALTKDSQESKRIERYMADSLLGITHDKIVYLGKVYQRRGAITLAEKNNLKLLYEPYHNGLGGNSDGEGYYTYCMNLPVITDEEATELDKKNKEEAIRVLNI